MTYSEFRLDNFNIMTLSDIKFHIVHGINETRNGLLQTSHFCLHYNLYNETYILHSPGRLFNLQFQTQSHPLDNPFYDLKLDVCCIFLNFCFFGDTLTFNNIQFGVTSCNITDKVGAKHQPINQLTVQSYARQLFGFDT